MKTVPIPSAPGRISRRLLDSPIVGALTTPNPVDRYLGLVNPTWSAREVRAEVTAVERQTARSVTLTLRPNSNWKGFKAGQHVGVTIEIDGIQRTRFYSPAGSQKRRDGQLEITVTAHPKGEVSQWLNKNAHPGMIIHLTQSQGEFVLPGKRPDHILLISGGSGITPAISMLRTLCDEGYDGAVTFLHYARGPKSLLYADELDRLTAENDNVKVVRAYTRAAAGELKGHFTRRHLSAADPDYAAAASYVCGPTSLVESVGKVWEKDGIKDRLSMELFVPPKPAVVTGDAVGTLHLTRSDLEIENDGTTLLAQAEAAGLSPKSGCRMGICHTCVCEMKNGTIRNVLTNEVKTIENEFVQICVNAPVGEVEIDL